MQYIRKNPEPVAWNQWRRTPDVTTGKLPTYETDDSASQPAKAALRAALAHEQGYLCGFCMARLDYDPARPDAHHTKIAHLVAQACSATPFTPADEAARDRLSVDYHNVVLACGGESEGQRHCDTYQEKYDILLPLTDAAQMQRIRFDRASAKIHHGDSDIDKQLNATDTDYRDQRGRLPHAGLIGFLNLNCPALLKRRRQRWLSIAGVLRLQDRFTVPALTRELETQRGKNARKQYEPDCAYVAQCIEEEINKLPLRKHPPVVALPRRKRNK